jgi:hypothetical protein
MLPIVGRQIHSDAQCAAAVEPAEYAEHDNSARVRPLARGDGVSPRLRLTYCAVCLI